MQVRDTFRIVGSGDIDERASRLGRIRRFFACWLVLLVALAAAPVLLAIVLEFAALVLSRVGRMTGAPDGQTLVLSLFWAYVAVSAGIIAGAPIVLLRRFIVRPDPPFLRAGYLGVAAMPFAVELGARGIQPGWYLLPLDVNIVLLLAALIYVALARRLRLFDPGTARRSST